MPPFSFPSDSSQKKIIKAFRKIGFVIDVGGKGSHIKVVDPRTKKWTIVQNKIYKETIRSYIKFIEELGHDCNKFIKYL